MRRCFVANTNETISKWHNGIKGGDIFVVDRGYHDFIPLFERNDFTYKMPALLGSNESLLTTEEANQSHLVTKTRWIIEARNGHIKSIFKFLRDVIPIIHAPNIGDYYRIAGVIINRYHPLIEMQNATRRNGASHASKGTDKK